MDFELFRPRFPPAARTHNAGDGPPRRLLMRHLKFRAPRAESIRVPLVSTPPPLVHPIAVEAVQHLPFALSEC